MRTQFLLAFFLSTCAKCIQALPTRNNDAVGVIWTFPNETWIENLAVRSNGEILATSLSRHAIYLVNPFEHTAITAHQFAASDGVLGITEIADDVFVVATAEVNLKTSTATKGSAKIWRVDMCGSETASPSVSLIAHLTNAILPDGVVALPETSLVLVADAAKGVIWRVDTTNGDYEVAISDKAFVPSNPLIPLGVDGVHIAGDYLYFTNLGSNLLGKVPIDGQGSATGPVENVTSSLAFPDDFALREDGTAFVVGANTLWQKGPRGPSQLLAGGINSTVLEGATSAQFGRTNLDQNVLYIGTNGGMLAPVDGTIQGGFIAAVNVDVLS